MFRQPQTFFQRISQTQREPIAVFGLEADPIPITIFAFTMIIMGSLSFLQRYDQLTRLNEKADLFHCETPGPFDNLCQQIHIMKSLLGDPIGDSVFLFPVTLSLMTLFALAKRTYDLMSANQTSPQHQIAYDFYLKNPDYPKNKEAIPIHCPLLQGPSNQPVYLSYNYQGRKYVHAYDYKELQKWFLSEGNGVGISDPLTNIKLLNKEVTHLKLCFDIPENVPEKICTIPYKK